MLSRLLASGPVRDERGFTLIEMLVSVLTGVVVVGALFGLLEVSLHQSARIEDVSQATQLGRTAMTRVVDELHSACISPSFTPVEAGSNESKLRVVNAYTENAEPVFGSKTRLDEIYLQGGTLIDKTYNSTGGTWPNFTFSGVATPSGGVILANNVSNTEGEKKEKVPIFQYYKYATKPSTSASAPSSTLEEATPLAGTLEAKTAETVASVRVGFRTAPASGSKETTRSVDLSDQVTFAFSAPNAEATIKAVPCE